MNSFGNSWAERYRHWSRRLCLLQENVRRRGSYASHRHLCLLDQIITIDVMLLAKNILKKADVQRYIPK